MILATRNMYQFCKGEVKGITFIYISKENMVKV